MMVGNREIRSTLGLKSRQRKTNQFRKLSESLSNERLMNESVKESSIEELQADKIMSMNNARPLKEKNKLKNKKNAELCESLKKDILSECFANLAYEALILDEEYKEEKKAELISGYKAVYESLMENGMLEPVMSPLYEAYISPAVAVFPEIDSNIETPEKIVASIKGCEKDLSDCEEKEVITEAIKEKVLDVIKEEKALASIRTDLKESYKNYDGTSLFNSLTILNFKNIKEEMLAEEESLTVDEFYNDKDRLQEVNDKALAETIIDYTLLETLNTCNLLVSHNGMDAEKIKKILAPMYKL